MGQKDLAAKQLESSPEVFADIINPAPIIGYCSVRPAMKGQSTDSSMMAWIPIRQLHSCCTGGIPSGEQDQICISFLAGKRFTVWPEGILIILACICIP